MVRAEVVRSEVVRPEAARPEVIRPGVVCPEVVRRATGNLRQVKDMQLLAISVLAIIWGLSI